MLILLLLFFYKYSFQTIFVVQRQRYHVVFCLTNVNAGVVLFVWVCIYFSITTCYGTALFVRCRRRSLLTFVVVSSVCVVMCLLFIYYWLYFCVCDGSRSCSLLGWLVLVSWAACAFALWLNCGCCLYVRATYLPSVFG